MSDYLLTDSRHVFPLPNTCTVRSGNSGRLYFKVVKTVPLPPNYCSHAVCKYPMFDFLINELSNLLGQSPVCFVFLFFKRVFVLLTISRTCFLVKASTHTNIQVLIIPLDLCLRIYCKSLITIQHSQLNRNILKITLLASLAGLTLR